MNVKDDIRSLAAEYATRLRKKIDQRIEDMRTDDTSHFLVYRILGVTDEEGRLIDVYQNKGRFLYRYAGAFLEHAAKHCFKSRFPESGSIRIPNTRGRRPSSPWRKSPLHSSGDASRLTALFVGCVCPICALLTPCQAGASPLSARRGDSTTGCQEF